MPLKWLPDETLYSLCCREHRVSGNTSHADTCISLFDHPYVGSRTDFPARLDALTRNSKGVLGSPQEIIYNHSVLPFFLHWQSEQFKSQILHAALASSTKAVVSTKYRLGLMSSSFPSRLPLKACSACINVDVEKYSTPYWHLSHQYPGVWYCKVHKLLLQEHLIDPELFRIKMWQLPSLNTLLPINMEGHTLINAEALTSISRLSSICEAYGRLPLEISLDQETLLKTHYEALESLALRANSKLLLTELSHSYCLAIRDLVNIPELSVLPLTAQEAKSQLATLFKKRASNTHPLRHLCFVYFLYGSWEIFWKAYNINLIKNYPTSALRASVRTVFASKTTSDLSARILALKNTIQCSSKEAANILGVNIETLIIHAERCGVPYPKRPKKLTPLIRASILNEFGKCIDLQKISDLYQVSIKTLKTLLRANPEIYLIHRTEKHKTLIESYRQRWSLNIKLHTNESVRGLRKLDSQAYTWLYRHDRNWLKAINKTRTIITTNNRLSLWQTRDTALLALLLPAIQSLQESKSLSLSNIFNRVPRLKKHIRNLGKLPKTCEALTACHIISKS